MDHKAPQIFHTKEDKPSNFVMYPTELFYAVNNIFNGNESKIMLVLLGCKGDGSFSPSTQYMLKATGITKPNHYFSIRKKLIENGYIKLDEQNNLYINIDKILNEYEKRTPNI